MSHEKDILDLIEGGGAKGMVPCHHCGDQMPENAAICPACYSLTMGSGQGEPVSLSPGTLCDERYRLEAPVGSGATAAVWRAYDTVMEEVVAIKFLRFDGGAQLTEYLARFRRELQLARRIHHHGIVANYDMGHWMGQPYLSMQYVEGREVTQIIEREHPLPLDRVVSWLTDIAGALHAAHAAGIIHRDLKSSNVLVDNEDRARILDFGIARHLMDPRQTLAGRVVGTPLYIAPEVAVESETVDHRADMYSFGVLAFQAFTGSYPFFDRNPVKVMMMHVQNRPPPPGSLREDLPASLEDLVLCCLEKNPDNRYRDFSEVLDILRSSLTLRTAGHLRAATTSETAQVKTPRVLVVDDDGTLRLLLKTLFEGTGLLVDVVPDAELAIDRLTEGGYALLVTDLVLPGKSGHDLAAWVGELPESQRIPVVIMTSLAEAEERERSAQLGVAGHLTKPLSIDEFTELVRRFFPAYANPTD